ncbi:phage tail length tape measure family protein [Delftia acidovorans]|uniref:phage tail length tape measure family protein n=1 Tax=Delftia acidovorans TaxID=80866 RepID=UPI003D0C866D
MTDTTRKSNLEFGVRNNTKAGLSEIKQDVKAVGDEAAQAGSKAGTAFDGMGKSSQTAASSIDRSTRSIISSLEREMAAMQAGGKGTAAYYETIARQRGADMAALGPYLQQMRLFEKQAEESFKTVGMSARATSAAMRGVPAQISDIVVSLQGGMPVMTVFMQQGLQLRDMFGGFAAAGKALGSTLLGLVNPYTVVAAAVVGFGAAMAYSESTLRTNMALMAQLEATGRAGFLNSDAIKQLKKEMIELPGISKSMASAIIADLVQVRTLGGEALQKIALLSSDFAAATGQDAAGAAKELAKAMEEPAKGARVLDEAFNFLTVSQLVAIEAMVEAGDKAGAQGVVLDALGARLKDLADNSLTPLQTATKNFGDAWDQAMANVANAGTLTAANDLVAGLVNRFAELVGWLNRARLPDWMEQSFKGGLNGMVYRAIVGDNIPKPAFTGGTTGSWGDNTGGASGSWGTPGAKSTADQELSELLDTTKAFKGKKDAVEDLNKTLGRLQTQQQRLRDEGRGDSKEADELQARINGVNEKIKSLSKTRGDGAKKEQSAYAELAASIQAKIDANKAEVTQSGKLNDAQKAEIKLNADLKEGKIKLSAAHEADLRGRIAVWKQQEKDKAKTKENVALYQQQLDIEKQVTEDYLKRSKALESARQAMDAYEKSAKEDFERLQLEAGLIGMSNQARAVALAQYDAELELKRKIAEIDRLDATTSQKDELIDRARVVSYQRVASAQTKAYNDEWNKAFDQASQSLSDALMAGGKNGAEYIEGLFRSLVLRPVIQAIVAPIAGDIASTVLSMLGMGPNGSSGGRSGVGLGDLSTMYKLGTSSLMKDFGLGLGNLVNNAGGKLYNLGLERVGSSLIDFGDMLTKYSGIINKAGAAFSYVSAILNIADGKWGAGLGTAVGQWFGGPIGAFIGNWIGGLLDKAFGSRGANHVGAAYSTTGVGNDKAAEMLFGRAGGDWYDDLTKRNSPELGKQLGQSVDAWVQLYKSLAGYAGGSAKDIDIVAGFATNPKYGDEDSYGYFKIIDKITGEVLKDYTARDGVLGTDPQKAWAQYMADMGGAVIDQLKKADIPGWMREEFDALGEDITIEGLNEALRNIAMIDSAFRGWADTLVGFADLTAKAQTELLKFSGGIEALSNNVNAFYSSFYSEEERAGIMQRQVREGLKALGVDIDPAGGEEAKKQFRKLIEDALASGNTELAAKLLAFAQMFGLAADYAQKAAETAADAAKTAADEAAKAVADARQKAKDAAMANFEAAVQREQDYWSAIASAAQSAISSMSAVLATLKSNARELYGSVTATQQMLAAQGMVYIEQALAGVRGGAKLSSYEGLTDAISAARGGISSGAYATQFEKDRDTLVLAGQLADLADMGDAQLSIEERLLKNSQEQLERLDKTLGYWRDLLEGNEKHIDATLSVEQAIKYLEALLFPESPGGTGSQPGKGGGLGSDVTPGSGSNLHGGNGSPDSEYKHVYTNPDGSAYYAPVTADDRVKRLNSLKDGYHSFDGSGDAAGLYAWAMRVNATPQDLAELSGLRQSDWETWLANQRVPSYDIGTNYVPRHMLAQIHEGEAILPKAFNPWAGGAMAFGGGSSDALLERLANSVDRLDARMASVGENTAALYDQHDSVTEGGNGMRAEIMNVRELAQAIAEEMKE